MVLTAGPRVGEFIMTEAAGQRSRDNIVIPSGTDAFVAGMVLGKVGDNSGVVTVTKTDVGGGKGAITLANPAYGAGVKEGDYSVVIIEPATDAGKFVVEDPDGIIVGTGTVAVAFDGVVKFTLADATDFVAGDRALIHVAIAAHASAGNYVPSSPDATDGSQTPCAIAIYPADASTAAVSISAITRDAEVNGNMLAYHEDIDDAPKIAAARAALRTAGIIVR